MDKEESIEVKLPAYLESDALPWMKWVEWKGDTFFACVNLERSLKAKRPMVDLGYCVTKMMNNCVIKTVLFKPDDFKYSRLND